MQPTSKHPIFVILDSWIPRFLGFSRFIQPSGEKGQASAHPKVVLEVSVWNFRFLLDCGRLDFVYCNIERLLDF